MTKLDRLGGALREIEAPLGRALQEHSPYLQWLDADLQLTYAQCGIATAAVQRYLAESCAVDTERKIASLSFVSDDGVTDHVRHVVLETDSGQTICPTYTQFYDLIGLSSQLAQQFDDMKTLLPEQKIAVFPAVAAAEFGEMVGEHALSVRDVVQKALSTRALHFFGGGTHVFTKASGDAVRTGYRNIWQPDNYTSFPLDAQLAGQNGERFEACVRKIVDAI